MSEQTITLAPAATIRPAAAPRTRPPTAPLLGRLELAAAVVATLLAGYLHVFFCQNVGALWRDEVGLLNVATMPTWGETWRYIGYESYPVLYFALVRTWMGIFGVDNDLALRLLGMLLGLGGIAALWLNARQLGARWPLFSLVLLGCNPAFVRYSDSNRAFGLGILLILLTLATVWRVLAAPRPGRVLLAMAAGVLSVQALYYNSILLLAICVGASVAAACERRWRTAAVLIAIGVPAALSMGVYLGTVRQVSTWNFVLRLPVSFGWLWHRLSDVLGSPDPLGVWVWSALFVGALGLAGWQLQHPGRTEEDASRTNAPAARVYRFAFTTLLVATPGYAAFLKMLNYQTQPWYYITFLALAAVCLDAILGRWLTGRRVPVLAGRVARLAFVLTMGSLSFLPARVALFARQTNVDLQAVQLDARAEEGDLIVCTHWECAITMARYYHGKAALTTLPPVDDHRFHHYDLIEAQMMIPEVAAPVLARMEATLRAGHRVWLSGVLLAPAGDTPPPAPPPSHLVDGKFAENIDYYHAWANQVGYLLRAHAVSATELPVLDSQPVLRYERLPLTVFEGWR